MNRAFRSVILFITGACRVGCATCNTGAYSAAAQHLSPEWMARFLAALSPVGHPRYLIWTGGEPFMAFDTLLAGIRQATARGYENEILTSGDWYAAQPDRAARLAEAGSFRLRISLDPEHQRTVPMEQIHALVDDMLHRRIHVGFTLRAIPGRNPDPGQTKALLLDRHPGLQRQPFTASRLFHVIPTIPAPIPPQPVPSAAPSLRSGAAHTVTTALPTEISARPAPTENSARSAQVDITASAQATRTGSAPAKPDGSASAIQRASMSPKIKGPCRLGFRDLIVGPDGRVYPCCGLFGLGIDDEVAAGDAITQCPETPGALVERHPLYRGLAEDGPYALAVQNGIIPQRLPADGYAGQCHACRSILPLLLVQPRNGKHVPAGTNDIGMKEGFE